MKTKHYQPLAPSNRLGNQRFFHPLRITRGAALVFLSSLAMANATIIQFDLSPTGTDTATGLSPANEAPAVAGSTGTGNEISGGIWFDTATSTLSYAIGYGSAAGFADLTGPATDAHIHGPAAAGASANVLFNLGTTHFPAADSSKGGILYGSIVYGPSQVADLLAGNNYVNIHTTANLDGEIRGQLIRVNVAPEIIPPANATVECGENIAYSATVSDFDGEAVVVTWFLNGAEVQTNDILAGGPPSSGVVVYNAKLPHGENTLTVTATDTFGNVTTSSSIITVEDTIAPVIDSLSVNPAVLWPPNHKMVDVKVGAKITDACGPAAWEILSVTSNEAVDAKGSGNTAPDWKITGDHTLKLRAERSGRNKAGRIYTIKVQATDDAGNKSEPATVTVKVPHNQGK